jgi:hypothetical protein
MIKFENWVRGGARPMSIEVPPPSFGYTVQLHKALSIQRFNGNIGTFDNGIKYDYRTCEFSLLLDEAQVKNMAAILNMDEAYKYDGISELAMTLDGGNFSPAGPDMGDSGKFYVSLVNNQSFSAMRTDYFGMFDCKLNLLFHNLPMPPIRTEPPELYGVWDFGDVRGMRDPERTPAQQYGISRSVTIGGGHSYTRMPTDEYTSVINQRTTTAKAAELLSYLQRVRGNRVTISAKKNYWIFGPDNEMQGDIDIKLLDNTFIFTHENVDTWRTTIQMWKDTGVAA